MNALFEDLKLNSPINSSKDFGKLHSKDYYLDSIINNDQNVIKNNSQKNYIYLVTNENINKLSQEFNELNFQYVKERQINIMNNKNNINANSKNSVNEITKTNKIESNEKNNKSTVFSLSEVRKFKTELCHSWELTGTCKYGLNVINKYII